MTPEEQKEVRARQRSRSIVVGLLLGALVILFYGISIAKIAGH
ncbi:MAG TPA: hypothetical protein VF509_11220 [Sphingobium sp.]|jgi:uncharacterized membrane protein YccC